MFKKICHLFYTKIISPIKSSALPPKEVALGAAIGMFLGLTPSVGLQMGIVWICWGVSRTLFKKNFDVVVGTAMVWISNPFTIPVLYYTFLICGIHFFQFMGLDYQHITYANFSESLFAITQNPEYTFWKKTIESFQYLIIDLGYPMMVGSLFFAIPSALLTYFVSLKYLESFKNLKKKII